MEFDLSRLLRYPGILLEAVQRIARELDLQIYIVGGAIRDCLLSEPTAMSRDLDLTVASGALDFAERLALDLNGTFVLLDREEGIARVVWQGYEIDLADYKDGAADIYQDLLKRDFTVNAMAVKFPDELRNMGEAVLIDPCGGRDDVRRGIIRAVSSLTFSDDPLRLLRAYRFQAAFGFRLDEETAQEIKDKAFLIERIALERISYELELIMATGRCCQTMAMLRDSGILEAILPELEKGVGMEQPAGHHLDVMDHNMAALCTVVDILKSPGGFFREEEVFQEYLARPGAPTVVKWAAFFHDLGKPEVMKIRDNRITFYNHDRAGAEQVLAIGRRLRWSKDKTGQISRLVAYHMWPFHLSNVRRKEGVTVKACLRLFKTVGEELPGLFLVAMADSLASQGPGRPARMEKELAELFSEVYDIVKKEVTPALASPRLITGRDLIELGLGPGPVFKDILHAAEEAWVTGKVQNRGQALAWLKNHVGKYYPELVR